MPKQVLKKMTLTVTSVPVWPQLVPCPALTQVAAINVPAGLLAPAVIVIEGTFINIYNKSQESGHK